MQNHIRVLGVVYLAVGGCMLLGAFLTVIFGGGASLVGATAEPHDAEIAIPVLGIAGMALATFCGLMALPSLVTGYGLLNFKPWSRVVGIVLSAISLINIPVGTIAGAYGLWVLLNKETERLFNNLPSTSPTL
jgi:hypothetical protein